MALREPRENRLDTVMTKAQVVRRKFNSTRDRRQGVVPIRIYSKMGAVARTMELLDRLRGFMREMGLDEGDVCARLIFCERKTPPKVGVALGWWDTDEEQQAPCGYHTLAAPEKAGAFVEAVMRLSNPWFQGVIFVQRDRETLKPEQQVAVLLWPMMYDLKAENALVAARNQVRTEGFDATVNSLV